MATSEEDLCATFKTACNVGATAKQAGKNTMTTKNLTKWFKSCKIYGKALTTTDTDIAFNKVKTKGSNEITFAQLETLLKEIEPKYKKDHAKVACGMTDMRQKLLGGVDTKSGTTGTSKTGGVDKMTDTSKYTGSHKERFDDSGKGKGAEGRKDTADGSGYVGNYKGEGTYDDKQKKK